MMDEQKKGKAVSRLNRIEGQIRGIRRMVEEDRYCMDILAQTRSIASALRSVEDIIMENHLNTCVKHAFESSDPREKQEKIDEVMTLFSQYRRGLDLP